MGRVTAALEGAVGGVAGEDVRSRSRCLGRIRCG